MSTDTERDEVERRGRCLGCGEPEPCPHDCPAGTRWYRAPDPDDGEAGGERESVAFWLGVWHRATPGIDYTPSDAPHLPPKWATDWRRGWCDTDMIETHEGYAAMRERGKQALGPLARRLRRSTPEEGVLRDVGRAVEGAEIVVCSGCGKEDCGSCPAGTSRRVDADKLRSHVMELVEQWGWTMQPLRDALDPEEE